MQGGKSGSDLRGAFSGLSIVKLVELEVFFFDATEEGHLAGIVLVHEDPATSMHKLAVAGLLAEVAWATRHLFHNKLARGKQPDDGRSLVSNGRPSIKSVNVDGIEAIEVLEDLSVGSSDRQLHLGQLGDGAEVGRSLGEQGSLTGSMLS